MATRRTLLKTGSAGLLTSLFSPWSFGHTVTTLLGATKKPQRFALPMPNPLDPARLFAPDTAGGSTYTLKISEFQAALGLVDPATGQAATTTLWGYGSRSQPPSYPGRTFNLRRGVPVSVRYANELKTEAGRLPYRLPVTTAACSVDNSQEAGHLWYRDHAPGVTRPNADMGLAGHYFIRDSNEDCLVHAGQLPAWPYELPVCIQDRRFTTAGEIVDPAADPAHLPESVGDVIVANGVPWPRFDCEARLYRLRLLNGSDSRVYTLRLALENFMGVSLKFWQIGTDLGLMDSPVALTSLTLAPGERADILVDFSKVVWWWHGKVIVMNSAATPFPNGLPPLAGSTDRVMAFSVIKPSGFAGASLAGLAGTSLPTNLRPVHGPLPQPDLAAATVRKLMLFEGSDADGRLQTLLGTVNPAPGNPPAPGFGTFMYADPVTEHIAAGRTEIWEIHNTTADAHPIHLHRVAFRVLDRQPFSGTLVPKPMGDGASGGYLTEVALSGTPTAAPAHEQGRKDTVLALPGEVTRIVATFDRPGEYVWHGPILSHDDRATMRRVIVA